MKAALSDVILLGTDEQVRLAAQAAAEMVACRRVETAALVVSLRSFGRGGRGEKGSGPTRAGAGGTRTGEGAAAGIGVHAPDHDDTST